MQGFDDSFRARLAAGARELGVPLDDAQLEALRRFAVMLVERNQHLNLTSITSPEGVLTLHLLDSLSVAPHLGDARTVIDVGTGGGFPGVPLAVACPQRRFTLIDGTQKKIRFVDESLSALGLGNARALAARAEAFPEKDFDVVIARAVASLAEVVHNAARLLAPRGRVLAMKGKRPDDELRALPRGWRADVVALRVPGLDAERHLVSISRQPAARK